MDCQEQIAIIMRTQHSIVPLTPPTSPMCVLGSKAGLQALLLKHGIDATVTYTYARSTKIPLVFLCKRGDQDEPTERIWSA